MRVSLRTGIVVATLLSGIGLTFTASSVRGAFRPKDNPIVINVPAPALTGGPWLNTPKNAPIKLSSRKGKVTVVEFWTFGCINCLHNLPHYARWQKRFAKKDVTIIGVHTPETDSEKVSANVVKRVKKLGITYPVLLDQEGVNWQRWKQHYWPTVYLIDKQGNVRYYWEGELEYNGANGEAIMSRHIEELLEEPYEERKGEVAR